jgi:N-methylhydantoinase B/oxoprolinase/acetone carboxylase alpha subunit
MSVVVPASQMVLMRKRKELCQLIQDNKWNEVSEMERELFNDINRAVQDPERSPKELLAELGSVISVYKELSALCKFYGKKLTQQ